MKRLPERVLQTIGRARARVTRRHVDLRGSDGEMLQIMALESGDAERIRRVLDIENKLTPAVAAHAIPLLASRRLAGDAVRALRPVADANAGKLLDRLLDATQPLALRRRIPRVLAASSSPRVVDGLLLALRSAERDVATQCARALLLIRLHRPDARIDESAVIEAVRRELHAEAPVLGNVFTFLSLILPPAAARSAYRAIRAGDLHIRGTALEYLRGVLPPAIREDVLRVLERG